LRLKVDEPCVAVEGIAWQQLGLPAFAKWSDSSLVATKLSTALDKKAFQLFREHQSFDE